MLPKIVRANNQIQWACKMNTEKSVLFLHSKQFSSKIKKSNDIYNSIERRKILRNKFNQRLKDCNWRLTNTAEGN